MFRRIACERIGESRILTTPSILSRAVKTGVINLGEPREAKAKLEGDRFRMRLGTFDDLFLVETVTCPICAGLRVGPYTLCGGTPPWAEHTSPFSRSTGGFGAPPSLCVERPRGL